MKLIQEQTMLNSMFTSALGHAPYLLFLGLYISILMNVSRFGKDGSLYNTTTTNKILNLIKLTWKGTLISSVLLGIIVIISKYIANKAT